MQTAGRVESTLKELAEKLVSRYAPTLLSVDWLLRHLRQAWMQKSCSVEEPDWQALELLAQGLCSQALCEGCLSPKEEVRELAFADLRRYLEEALSHGVARSLSSELRAEVLQQTLLEIWSSVHQHGAGPDKPRAFLKWAHVILLRQLSKHRDNSRRAVWLSLETQPEQVFE